MKSLNALKQELINQKETIESKSGFVNCAHEHPSPAEITEGIKTIPSTDLSAANATESDVALGKTFYAGNSELKTGTSLFDVEVLKKVFMYSRNTVDTEAYYYTMPTGIKEIRRYLFSENDYTVYLRINPDVELIEDYAFYESRGIVVENFDELVNLKKVATFAFANARAVGINIGNLPNNIEILQTSCFQSCCNNTYDYRFPDNLNNLGIAVFKQEWRVYSGNLDLSNYNLLTSLPGSTFYFHSFNCDLVVPSQVTSIGSYFNYNGSFKNIEIHSGVNEILAYAFGAGVNDFLSNYHLQTVTIGAETPPKFGTEPFAPQHVLNGFKIYVPDNSVEEYKAVTELYRCVNCIYPMSQKD